MTDTQFEEYVATKSVPFTISQIAIETESSLLTVSKRIKGLMEKGTVETVGDAQHRYYIATGGLTCDEIDNLRSVMGKAVANGLMVYDDLKDSVADIKGQINSFYANIIAIMGIFVAVFTLITINVKITADVLSAVPSNAISASIIINASTILAIFALMVLLRILVINPLVVKSKKPKEK